MVFSCQHRSGLDLQAYRKALRINNDAYASVSSSYAEVTQQHAEKERENIRLVLDLLGDRRGAVADFGCGFGRDAEFWEQNGMKYYGCDASIEMLQEATRRNIPGSFFQMDMIHAKLAKESVLVTWFSSALQHVPSAYLPYILETAFVGLKQGGFIYANYRSPKDGVCKEGEVESGEYQDKQGNPACIQRFIAHYSQQEMQKALQNAGFEVLDARSYEEIYGRYDEEKGEYLRTKEIIFGYKA